MDYYLYNQTGKIFREIRDAKGIKIEDLVERGLSAGTISHFETGKRNVKPDKIIKLFGKIGVSEKELVDLIKSDEEKEAQHAEKLEVELLSIENNIDLVNPNTSLKRLKQIKPNCTTGKFLALIEFLTAQAYYKKDNWQSNWKKSEFHFYETIKICLNNPESDEENLLANAYYGLARINFRENNLTEALEFVQKGLDSYNKDRNRKFIFHQLLLSKAIFLEKLEHNEEAHDILNELWETIDHTDTESALNMYELAAILYIKSKRYTQAIPYCLEGIHIARRHKNYDRSFELWVALGKAYRNLGKLDQAKICLQTAAQFEDKIKWKFLTVQNDIQLGELYLNEGQIDQAREILEQAIVKGKRVNDSLSVFKSLVSLGDCYLKQNDQEQAIGYYEKALEITQRHKLLVQQCDLALQLGALYENRDLIKYNKYSTLYFRLSIQLAKSRGGLQMIPNETLPTNKSSVTNPPDN
ncbi:helix-turn-helix domain-containing protein [Risungbinella massiliensis]|uniref:helix-turn-helix domain-containing protein n=1 Tax=Risungbinella massiliensis TaxID=1329796 RepID=UPI0005CC62A4|nr:tetratricopeptide repeat protein [Risungbinella massiliensis]